MSTLETENTNLKQRLFQKHKQQSKQDNMETNTTLKRPLEPTATTTTEEPSTKKPKIEPPTSTTTTTQPETTTTKTEEPVEENSIPFELLTKEVLKKILVFKEPQDYKGKNSGGGGKALWVSVNMEVLAQLFPDRKFVLNQNRLCVSTAEGVFPFGYSINYNKNGYNSTLSAKGSKNQERMDLFKQWCIDFDNFWIETIYENREKWLPSPSDNEVAMLKMLSTDEQRKLFVMGSIKNTWQDNGKNGTYRPSRPKEKEKITAGKKEMVEVDMGDAFKFNLPQAKDKTGQFISGSFRTAPFLVKCFTCDDQKNLTDISPETYRQGEKVGEGGKILTIFNSFYGFQVVEFKSVWFVKGFGPSWEVTQQVAYTGHQYQTTGNSYGPKLDPAKPRFTIPKTE